MGWLHPLPQQTAESQQQCLSSRAGGYGGPDAKWPLTEAGKGDWTPDRGPKLRGKTHEFLIMFFFICFRKRTRE